MKNILTITVLTGASLFSSDLHAQQLTPNEAIGVARMQNFAAVITDIGQTL